MSDFREFMAEDIWHLEAYLTGAGNNARRLLESPAPTTEKQIKRHNDLELCFDSQLKHIRAYLNGMWAEDEATEKDGPPQAIDEVGKWPMRIGNFCITEPGERRRVRFHMDDIDAAALKPVIADLNQVINLMDERPSEMIPEFNREAAMIYLYLENAVKTTHEQTD